MNMPELDKAALQALIAGWIVKKSLSSPPQKLGEEDCAELAGAAADGNALCELTRGWIVQRERGAVPSRLLENDFREIKASLGLEGKAVSRQPEQPEQSSAFSAMESIPVSEAWQKDFMPADTAYENDVLADGRLVRDALQEDPFYFARLHLSLSL